MWWGVNCKVGGGELIIRIRVLVYSASGDEIRLQITVKHSYCVHSLIMVTTTIDIVMRRRKTINCTSCAFLSIQHNRRFGIQIILPHHFCELNNWNERTKMMMIIISMQASSCALHFRRIDYKFSRTGRPFLFIFFFFFESGMLHSRSTTDES